MLLPLIRTIRMQAHFSTGTAKISMHLRAPFPIRTIASSSKRTNRQISRFQWCLVLQSLVRGPVNSILWNNMLKIISPCRLTGRMCRHIHRYLISLSAWICLVSRARRMTETWKLTRSRCKSCSTWRWWWWWQRHCRVTRNFDMVISATATIWACTFLVECANLSRKLSQ